MFNLDKDIENVYFIGIGGIGVSAIAEIFLKRNIKVFGSDIKKSFNTEKLESLGATIFYEHSESNITEDIDIVIYTSAVNESNAELKKAKKLGVPTYSRAEILGMIMTDFSTNIAISGTHGKTTTTSLLSLILDKTNLDPTLLIGGNLKEFKGNAKIGNGNILVTEACEYRENFLLFNPTTVAILNIDEDHLDYYRDINHISSSFIKFANIPGKKGKVFINLDDVNTRKIIGKIQSNVITFGISNDSDYTAKNLVFDSFGHPEFDVFFKDVFLGNFKLNIPGRHNVYNALAAISMSHDLGINYQLIKEIIESFSGTERRFQKIGDYNGAMIVDDYAHHPTEIKATLESTKKIDHNKVICIFQPHTYTRTKELLDEFSNSFYDADIIIIADIYAAREINDGTVHSKDLVELIKSNGKKALYFPTFEEIAGYVKSIAKPGDIIFTMGAGNVTNISNLIIK